MSDSSPALPPRSGILCVVSGPSGSGKTTLCRRFVEEDESAVYAVSATTRHPRGEEQDGVDYYFLNHAEFESGIAEGRFLEHAEVHGEFYGTLKSEVLRHLVAGKDVLMDIDVQGAALIRASSDREVQRALLDLFILLPSEEALLERVRSRGTESEDQIALRLRNARSESRHWRDYQYTIISADRETDFTAFRAIMQAERFRSRRLHRTDDAVNVER